MSLQINLTEVINNDLDYSGQAKYAGSPLNLTGMSMVAVIKASRQALDNSGTSFAPTIATGTQGEFTWVVPRTDNATAGTFWYRIDIDDAGDIATLFFGLFTVLAA